MEGTKIIYLRRKVIAAAACALAAAMMFWVVNNPAVVGASAATQQLIDIVSKYPVQATFFVVGEWVDKYPESVKALSDAGHEVMGHSNTHAHFNSLSSQEIVDDLNACNDKIEAVTGVRPTLFRCPYGEYDDHVINAVRSLDIEPIQWDVEASAPGSSGWGARCSGGYSGKKRAAPSLGGRSPSIVN